MSNKELCEQNVTEILSTVRKLGPEVPTMIWGSPGIGKTEATKEAFKDHEIVLVLAGCSEPTDISGVPFEYRYDGEPVATQILAPIWAYHASVKAPPEYQKKKYCIFFDDIVTGHEQTQAACFKVFGEKKVGNLDLRDDVYIIAAGNRVEDKSAAYEMPLALANRMKHYYAKCDTDAWIEWAISPGLDKNGKQQQGINPLVVAFIRSQKHKLNLFEEAVKMAGTEKAFATPRTWHNLSKDMFKMDPKGGIGEWLYRTAVGHIGSGVGMEFATFCRNTTGLIPPEEICKHPATATIPDKTQVDILYATITALEYHINQPENWNQWDKALEYVLREGMEPEFGLFIAKMATIIALQKLSEEDRLKAVQNKHFKEMYTRYGSYLANPEG